jgi:hypothetical protein
VPKKFGIVAAHLHSCSCQGYKDILAGVVYKVACYFCDTFFDADPKCAKMYFDDPHSCRELCGASLCDKYRDYEELVSHWHQCSGCGQHIWYNCIQTMDYMNYWKCNIPICNNYMKDCSATCYKITTVRSVGGTKLGTIVSVDPIIHVLSTRKLNVTLMVSMVVTVAPILSLKRSGE